MTILVVIIFLTFCQRRSKNRENHYSFVGSCQVSAVFRHVRSTQKEQFNYHIVLLEPYHLRRYVNATSVIHEESVSWCSRVGNPRRVLQRDSSPRRCFQGDKELQIKDAK